MTAPTNRKLGTAAILAVATGLLLLLTGAGNGGTRLWGNLLIAGVNLTHIGLGGLFLVAVARVSNGRWTEPIIPVLRATSRILFPALGVMLALWFGAKALYPWARPEALADPVLRGRAVWLNPGFFWARILFFFILWLGLGSWLWRQRKLSAPFIVIFAVTFSLASFDWIMSVEPQWCSTIFAIYGFAGMLLQVLAVGSLSAVALRRLGMLPAGAKSPFPDLGKMLFAFSAFWAYIWLSQFILIWYTNLPGEVVPLKILMSGPWAPWFYLNVALNFVLPFHLLMSRKAKENEGLLLWAGLILMAGHWLDLYLLVFPPLTGGAAPALGAPEAGGILLTFGLTHLAYWPALLKGLAEKKQEVLISVKES